MSAMRITRRALLAMGLALGALGIGGCIRQGASGGSGELSTLILVDNRGYWDVNVYAIRSSGGAGRRLGTVQGGSKTTLRVPSTDQQPGGGVMLSLRAIGSPYSWTSPLLVVGFGSVARLDIMSTSGGDLSQTQFYLSTTM